MKTTYVITNYGESTTSMMCELTDAEYSLIKNVCDVLYQNSEDPYAPKLRIREATKEEREDNMYNY